VSESFATIRGGVQRFAQSRLGNVFLYASLVEVTELLLDLAWLADIGLPKSRHHDPAKKFSAIDT
jgi:hypothetical protein